MKNLVRRVGIAIPAALVGGVAMLGLYAHASSVAGPNTTGQTKVPTVQTSDPVDQPDSATAGAKDTDTVQSGSQDDEQADGADVGHTDSGGTEVPDAGEAGGAGQ